jgi:hypothetical protein
MFFKMIRLKLFDKVLKECISKDENVMQLLLESCRVEFVDIVTSKVFSESLLLYLNQCRIVARLR